ncbi:MAG: hypothetical protein K0R26_1031 [Bacteroidota bacterium]|jgi:hypothetical protein|nr:hypothetical protein [Bacteroidota bacterium]
MAGQDRLELHYFFDDDTHTIDAFVRNKCEAEVLAIAKEVISTYTEEEIIIQNEIPEEGGFTEVLTFFTVNKDAIIAAGGLLSLIVSTITLVLSRRPPIHPSQLKYIQAQDGLIPDQAKLVEAQTKVAESQAEINELSKTKLKLEIGKLNAEQIEKLAEQYAKEMNSKITVIQRKSNFYKQLQSSDKITKVKATSYNGQNTVTDPKPIDRVDFPLYILNTNKLHKEKDEDAILEITSPVITQKKSMKWRGIYKDQPISFKMKDKVFKQSVANGQVNLHENYLVKCLLHFVPELKEDGTVENKDYSVSLVKGEVTEKEVIETMQGRMHRLKRERLEATGGESSQATLFGEDEL